MHDYGWNHIGAREKQTILSGFESGETLGGPYHMEIHPTDRCDIACRFCSTQKLRSRTELTRGTVDRLLDQAVTAGVRSVSISGGGEPLVGDIGRHVITRLAEHGVPVAHIATNGLGLDSEVGAALISGRCDQIRISLNVADRDDYSRMMGVGPACFDRVVANIRRLNEMRKGHRRTRLIVQFLVDRSNFRSVPEIYRFGRSLGVDGMIFNGLSYVEPADRMSPSEISELVDLYRQVLEEDEYRFIIGIHNYEHDLSDQLHAVEAAIGVRRGSRTRFRRLRDFIGRRETPRKTIEHRRWMKARSGSRAMAALHGEPCLLPWYSMIIRADGSVPPCCTRQHASVATVETDPLVSIWRGARMAALRRQLRAAVLGERRELGGGHPGDQICSAVNSAGFQCPFKATFYRHDLRFSRRLAEIVEQARSHPAVIADATTSARRPAGVHHSAI